MTPGSTSDSSADNHPASGRRLRLFLLALVAPFVILRAILGFVPEADFNIAGHNVHHLFTGLLLICAGGIPLAVSRMREPAGDLAAALFGVGLGLALDEWLYLIVTDGSNRAYLLPVSFWGGAVMIGLAAAWAMLVWRLGRRRVYDRSRQGGRP